MAPSPLQHQACGMADGVSVGDTARMSRIVTDRDIEPFGEITGDRNPLHFDSELATRSRFGGIIVRSGITSGLLNAVVAEKLPGPRRRLPTLGPGTSRGALGELARDC